MDAPAQQHDQDGYPVDAVGKPMVRHPGAKLSQLERMIEWRERKLAEGAGNLDHFRAELDVLKSSRALHRHYRNELDGTDQPALALQELVDAIAEEHPVGSEVGARTMAAYTRAKKLLEDP